MSGRERRRRSILARRPVRLAILVVLLLAIGGTVARVLWVRRGGAGRERWKLHDEALLLFEADRYDNAAAAYRRILGERPGDKIARFNLGLALVRSGDEAGWSEIEAVAAADSTFDDAQIALADRATDAGNLGEAARRLATAIAQPPEPRGARLRLAQLQLRRGHRGQALRHLRTVMHSDGESPLSRATAAVALAREHGRQADLHRSPAEERMRERGAYVQALQIVDGAIGPDRPPEDWDDATVALAALRPFALSALGRHEEALGAVEQVLRAPLDPPARSGLRVMRAQLYWLEGAGDRAEQELEEALAVDARPDAEAFSAAADLFESRGFRDRAADVLTRGLTEHPRDESLRLSLARVRFLTGDVDGAEATLRGSSDVPENDAALLFLADLRRFRGERLEARRAYEMLRDRQPQRRDVRLRLASLDAQVAFEEGRNDDGAYVTLAGLADEALERDPFDAEALLARARAQLLRIGRGGAERATLVKVRDRLKAAIDADPLLFEAHVVLAHVQARLGSFEAAAVGLERVLAGLPVERPALRLLLAEAYLGLGAPERALREAQRAVSGLGNDVSALRTVVAAARLAGDRAAALRALDRLVEIQPQEIEHRLAQAAIHARAGAPAAMDEALLSAESLAEELEDDVARAAALRRVTDARAEMYARRGDVARARTAFADLLERFPTSVDAHVSQGRFLRVVGRTDEAEQAFRRALAISPGALEASRALFELIADRGEMDEELTLLVRGMRENGAGDPRVLYVEGRLAALQGDLALARDRLEAAAEELQEDADVQFALGIVLSRSGRLDEAVAVLERARGLAPRSERAREALARARFAMALEMARLGRLRAARGLLEGAVADDPDAEAPRRALADVLGMTASLDVSEQQMRAMLLRDPDDAVLRRMLAHVLIREGDLEGASRELLWVAEESPGDWTLWSTLSAVRLRMRDVDGATRFARRARSAAPDDPRSLAPTLQILATTGQEARVRELLDAAVAEEPAEPFYLLLRATQGARDGRHEDVVRDARAALELSPGMTRAAHLAIDSLRYGLADPQRALAFARECAERAPEIAEYAFLAGWLLSDGGDGAAALATLRPLAERDPPHQPALESVALILVREGATGEARELLDRGLVVNPENPNLHYLRAQSLLRDAAAERDPEVRGATRGAVIAALERTLELAPPHHTARNNLAFVLSAEGERLAEALEHALRACAEAPKHATYVDTLGTVQMRMGRLDRAVESFERALALVAEARAVLGRPDSLVAASEPGRAARLRRRLERQEDEIRRHLDEALRRRRGG